MTLDEELMLVNLRADYHKTLALLRAAQRGELDLRRVVVTPDGWNLMAPAPDAPAALTAPHVAAPSGDGDGGKLSDDEASNKAA